MKRSKLYDLLIVVLILIILICLGILGHRFFQYHQGISIYDEAERLVNLPDFSEMTIDTEIYDNDGQEPANSNGSAAMDAANASANSSGLNSTTPLASDSNTAMHSAGSASSQTAPPPVNPYTEALKQMDFSKLREVNSDVLGWIIMPNTTISYPVVQAADNDFYLYRTWNLADSIVGSIFLDANCTSDLSDFNTIIYGHNMNNGSMFGSLKKFKTADYWTTHPTFMITTDSGVYMYKIFSAFEASLSDPVFMVRINREDEKQALIDCALSKSTIDTGIVPTIDDHIVTLSTCTGRGHETRWVLLGILDRFQIAETPNSDNPQVPETD